MKFFMTLLLSLAVMFPLTVGQEAGPQPFSVCDVIGQALKNSQQIGAGVPRREVERYFERDGGAQFPSSTRYVYAQCRYLRIDVEFETKGVAGQLFSPDDLVVKTSRLYVDSPTKD
jgi:hypothetical protein